MDPAVSLRVLKAVPTLKAAFSQRDADDLSQNVQQKKTRATKKCIAHFGCTSTAVFQETSGTLFCKEHKPKQVAVTPVLIEKQSTKKSTKKS